MNKKEIPNLGFKWNHDVDSGQLFLYTEKGKEGLYITTGWEKIKHPQTNEWLDYMGYRNTEGLKFARPVEEFRAFFKPVVGTTETKPVDDNFPTDEELDNFLKESGEEEIVMPTTKQDLVVGYEIFKGLLLVLVLTLTINLSMDLIQQRSTILMLIGIVLVAGCMCVGAFWIRSLIYKFIINLNKNN